jgi:CRP/FNR family cyclic AMP-dependent transcriptional regulator
MSKVLAGIQGFDEIADGPRGRPTLVMGGLGNGKTVFAVAAFLEDEGAGQEIVSYEAADVIYRQGEPSRSVLYLRSGGIRLSVVSDTGNEAIVATLGPGDFLGEGALAGQPVRLETAHATMASTILVVPKRQMISLLHCQHALSDRFIAHLLARNASLQADVIDLLFNSSEKRLARALLLLTHSTNATEPQLLLPNISQKMLAQTIGTTRSRVNCFLNRFRRLGFIDYSDGALTVHPSLLCLVLQS